MKITLAQLNPKVGDFDANVKKVVLALDQASRDKADLVVFPELYLTGYTPRDLLDRPDFRAKITRALEDIKEESKRYPTIGLLIGMPTEHPGGRGLYNSALLIENGELLFTQHKSLLPFYDVFDENRYFDAATSIDICTYKNETLGILICEDSWGVDPVTYQKYKQDPMEELSEKGATLFITMMASPFEVGKPEFRFQLYEAQAKLHGKPAVYVNQVGGNDELIFDGYSLFLNAKGEIIHKARGFEEDVVTVDIAQGKAPLVQKVVDKVLNLKRKRQQSSTVRVASDVLEPLPEYALADTYKALCLGLKDYVLKCGFKRVILGLSGGIDSALVACIATEALGSESVLGVSLPSPYSSEGSKSDANQLARNLSIVHQTLPITPFFESTKHGLTTIFDELHTQVDWTQASQMKVLTEENLQSRLRGVLLMALSNQINGLLLSTGNKSEMAVGYCTLYGDMNGAINVLSDVPKTLVYQLANYINRHKEIIPRAIIDKAPSAELSPNQKDADSLPPYHVLDGILFSHLDRNQSRDAIIEEGFDEDTVDRVLTMVAQTEYKRRQACPGLKISSKAFGMGRRVPLAATLV